MTTSQNLAGKSSLPPSRSEADETLRAILVDTLALDPKAVAEFDGDTGLFGHLPELDSMAVATLLTEIEDRYGFHIDDDDVDAEMLETYGALFAFIEAKLVTG
ncbi:acyl carrier protein [Altererythrobacter sp. MF3-039]|uniref:acyl carrier protein n=1 Tax=Altererythrobacter sp. MF3-039 TaxID=3252901 RepID=UPI00390C9805